MIVCFSLLPRLMFIILHVALLAIFAYRCILCIPEVHDIFFVNSLETVQVQNCSTVEDRRENFKIVNGRTTAQQKGRSKEKVTKA